MELGGAVAFAFDFGCLLPLIPIQTSEINSDRKSKSPAASPERESSTNSRAAIIKRLAKTTPARFTYIIEENVFKTGADKRRRLLVK